MNGVEQQAKTSGDAEKPEAQGNDAFSLQFRSQPLDKKSHEEQELGEKTEDDPDIEI